MYELPIFRDQQGFLGRVLGGFQLNSLFTFQSGAPFTPLNGSDPTGALNGIDSLVGNSIRPNLNTRLDVSRMSIEELLRAGGAALFSRLPTYNTTLGGTQTGQRVGNAGRNILRADGIGNVDFGIAKNTRLLERHTLQFRADMFNATNTRNFGIPNATITAGSNFLNQWATNGGNRRIQLGLRYTF